MTEKRKKGVRKLCKKRGLFDAVLQKRLYYDITRVHGTCNSRGFFDSSEQFFGLLHQHA